LLGRSRVLRIYGCRLWWLMEWDWRTDYLLSGSRRLVGRPRIVQVSFYHRRVCLRLAHAPPNGDARTSFGSWGVTIHFILAFLVFAVVVNVLGGLYELLLWLAARGSFGGRAQEAARRWKEVRSKGHNKMRGMQ
jgi:hypothetical protein